MNKKLTEIETRAWVGLVRTQQILLDKVEAELKNHRFPPLSWYDVLIALENTSEGRLRFIEIGERVLLKKYNVTRLVHRLEREGHVRREICTEDGRGIYAVITKKGLKLRRAMWKVYYGVVQSHFLSNFNKEELEKLADYFGRIKLTDQ